MLVNEMKNLARRFYEDVFNKGEVRLADELFSLNFTYHDPFLPHVERGPEGVKALVTTWKAAFPDLTFRIEDQFVDGDYVITRWVSRGTHKSELMGIQPTGREGEVTGIGISKITNGRIVEAWANWDTYGLLRQLGFAPALEEKVLVG
jgi:steroid delta-isomerase-like uncharacterized protein